MKKPKTKLVKRARRSHGRVSSPRAGVVTTRGPVNVSTTGKRHDPAKDRDTYYRSRILKTLTFLCEAPHTPALRGAAWRAGMVRSHLRGLLEFINVADFPVKLRDEVVTALEEAGYNMKEMGIFKSTDPDR